MTLAEDTPQVEDLEAPATMRQLLQSYRDGELWIAEVPRPRCGAGSVLVQTTASVVSAGTERMLMQLAKKSLLGKARQRPDLVKQVLKRIKVEGLSATLEKVRTKLDEPIALGYSAAGVVLEVGREVRDIRPGDRVACAGAGYATHSEVLSVPQNLVVRVPEGVSDSDAAYATIGAIALQGVRQTEPRLGERIVVIGLGLLGLITVQLLKANGCAVLGVDLDPKKAARARELGADMVATTDVEAACARFTGGRGADAVVIAAATPSNGPLETAAEIARAKAKVVVVGLVGMNVPRDPFYKKELDLRLSMSYGPGRYDGTYEEGGVDYPIAYVRFTEQRNLETFLYLIGQGVITPSALTTHRLNLDDALCAYQLLDGSLPAESELSRDYLGIVLTYGDLQPRRRSVVTPNVPSAPPARGRLSVGFIGAGSFAKSVLLPRLSKLPGIHLAAVSTSSGSTAALVKERYGFERAAAAPEEILTDPSVDAVFVVTPHSSHASLACRALRAGKHAFVEKPMMLQESDAAEYERAFAAAQASGHAPCLMVGFNRRFSPHGVALQQRFRDRSGPLVVSYRVNAGRIPTEHWIQDPKIGGGRIIGECCHFVDFCQALVGARPTRVTASTMRAGRRDVVDDDSISINIEYADGSLANLLYLSEGHRDLPKERCEVHGGGLSAVMEDYRVTHFIGGGRTVKGPQAKGFAEELDAFRKACADGTHWPIQWQELLDTHRVCLAAIASTRTGLPVTLA
jgi:predicted dehydrogenase